MKRVILLVSILAAVSCGSSGGGPPTSPPVLTTEAFLGNVTQSTTGCNSSTYNFTAQAGTMTVRLDATNSAAQDIAVQICSGTGNAKVCSLPLQRIIVGQTLSANSTGTFQQTLSLLRMDCVVGGGVQAPGSITFATTLTYFK